MPSVEWGCLNSILTLLFLYFSSKLTHNKDIFSTLLPYNGFPPFVVKRKSEENSGNEYFIKGLFYFIFLYIFPPTSSSLSPLDLSSSCLYSFGLT